MTDKTSRDRILKAVKRRVKESDERERVRMIANTIGDRRDRDLVDVIAQIEQDEGWSSVLGYLRKAQDQKYSLSMTLGKTEAELEQLKYREVVFNLLSCSGLEPVPVDTSVLLSELDSEKSLIDASNALATRLENLAVTQIKSGDTLFYDFSDSTTISQKTIDLLQRMRSEKLRAISLVQDESIINISPLWYCEQGRVTLTSLGIRGNQVTPDILSRVLSVIQEPVSLQENLNPYPRNNDDYLSPANKLYKELLDQIIQQDIEGLSRLASKHALPTLNALLDESISQYSETQSATAFNAILQHIQVHVTVRAIDSLMVLEKASEMTDNRVATMAILAIGNFYHESAVSSLVEILCTNKKQEIIDTAIRSIRNVHKRCPETDYVIETQLDRDCMNRGKLLSLQRALLKERGVYYQ
ncbi:MAG: hypothetical protein ACFFF9_01675 [Candidatus Thorarchaeota archaeon]